MLAALRNKARCNLDLKTYPLGLSYTEVKITALQARTVCAAVITFLASSLLGKWVESLITARAFGSAFLLPLSAALAECSLLVKGRAKLPVPRGCRLGSPLAIGVRLFPPGRRAQSLS